MEVETILSLVLVIGKAQSKNNLIVSTKLLSVHPENAKKMSLVQVNLITNLIKILSLDPCIMAVEKMP